ncbi:MAG: hypothetical protein NVSMB64_25200 [Candidatus Velthaea sp.]
MYTPALFDFRVIPYTAEPYDTDTTDTAWMAHLGCLTNAYVALYSGGIYTPPSGNINAKFPNAPLTELGYDLPVGSHGGPAPYIITMDNATTPHYTYYGCNTSTVVASDCGGWERHRFQVTSAAASLSRW